MTVPAVKVTMPVLAGPVFAVTAMVARPPVAPLDGDTVIHEESEAMAAHEG